MSNIDKVKQLVVELNNYRDSYYNEQNSIISDFTYDKKIDELIQLEQETGFILSNSPTQTVGYMVKSKLNKITHNHPMLSLDKTKNTSDVIKFFNKKQGVVMAKMDGLTCSLRYIDGKLISAETRGDGVIGEDVLHCAKTIKNLPLCIPYTDEVIIDGEVIITYKDFEEINNTLPEDQQYKHPRNLASGSIRQLDSSIAAKRNMKFVAWKLIKGTNSNSFADRWHKLCELGFEAVPIEYIADTSDEELITQKIEIIKSTAKQKSYPIDGCVFGYDDIAYGDSLGATEHHLKSQLAYKFYDDLYETTLRDIEWTMGKTSVLTPTAVFDPVDIDNTTITRASVHNISILKNLGLTKNCTIRIYKANSIIPQIDSADQNGDSPIIVPEYCPLCGEKTNIIKDNKTEVLVCTNTNCSGKLLGRMKAFVDKTGVNIEGMSESILQFLIKKGWVKNFVDLYHLDQYADIWKKCEGFGEKSVNNLLKSIEKSRNVKLENFITAISIPNIGLAAAKTIAKHFNNDWYDYTQALANNYDFTQLEDFGEIMNKSLHDWWNKKESIVELLPAEFVFSTEQFKIIENNFIKDKTFVVTGAFESLKRSEIEKIITDRGGKLSGSVSKKTDYLLTNEVNSGSNKAKKAIELNIPVINETDFLKKLEEI